MGFLGLYKGKTPGLREEDHVDKFVQIIDGYDGLRAVFKRNAEAIRKDGSLSSHFTKNLSELKSDIYAHELRRPPMHFVVRAMNVEQLEMAKSILSTRLKIHSL